MDTIKINRKQTKIIAHRGVSGIERENTCAAFAAAGIRSYFGIETDVHKTLDGQYVIIHDENTSRVTNGAMAINVEESPYSAIKDILLPDLNGNTGRQELRIPLLADYIRICRQYKKECILELKNPFSVRDIETIIELIKNEQYLEHVIFISFVLENCIRLRSLLPGQPVQWLLDVPVSEDLQKILYRYQLDLDVYYPRLDQELITKLHANHTKVNCWTCNDKQTAEKLASMGVDFITSNILE